ncbi:hypothetical protein JXQ31_06545 [candidate division KSB1 bacterium]|nr:hypothetical protein [candidate division KSB1 bacterium]
MKRTNNQLKQNIVKLENRNGFLNSEKVYKSEKNDTNNNIVKDNSIQFDFRNILSDKIDVQDLKITIPEKEAKIDISFKVINLEESDEPAKGYVIVGGFPEKGKISDHIFFPQSVQLNSDRVITNFEKGEPFSIRKFKNEKIAFLKPTSFDIKNIVIFVFSEQGDIISRKVEKIHAW